MTKQSKAKTPGVEPQLTALIPSSINDVIRTNGEQASLRFSTESDLRKIEASFVGPADGISISKWLFITLDVRAVSLTRLTAHLFGVRNDDGHSWCTSPVMELDGTAELLCTRSRSVYRLSGPKGTERDLDLLRLCAYLHQTAIGTYPGVPHVFY